MEIHFDLSSIFSTANIEKATFSLYRAENLIEGPYGGVPKNLLDKYDYDCTFFVHQVTKAWTEADANWETLNNAFEPKELDSNKYKKGFKAWVDFDVTSIVKEYVKNPNKNFGFVVSNELKLPNTDSGNMSEFFSSEFKEVDKRPKLTIISDNTKIYKKEIISKTTPGMSIYCNISQIRLYSLHCFITSLTIFGVTGKKIT